MHKMHHHIRQLAFHRFLAGMMKVKLLQVVAHAAVNDITPRIDIDAYGIARVLQLDRACHVMELDGRQILVQVRPSNVDGRLLVSLGARFICRVELPPFERTGFSLVAPGRGGLRRGNRGTAQHQRSNLKKAHEDLLFQRTSINPVKFYGIDAAEPKKNGTYPAEDTQRLIAKDLLRYQRGRFAFLRDVPDRGQNSRLRERAMNEVKRTRNCPDGQAERPF